jgi:hypothetical protein
VCSRLYRADIAFSGRYGRDNWQPAKLRPSRCRLFTQNQTPTSWDRAGLESGHPMSAIPPIADVNGHGAGGPLLTQTVWKLFFGDRDEILIHAIGLCRKNDSLRSASRFTYCAEALGVRVFTRPGPIADIGDAGHSPYSFACPWRSLRWPTLYNKR